MDTNQTVVAELSTPKYHFTVDPAVQAQNRAAHDAKKAQSATKKRYDEALRLDRLRDIERNEHEAREAVAKAPKATVVATECTLSDEEREASRLRAEADAEAARKLLESKDFSVKVVPERAPIPKAILEAGLKTDLEVCARINERRMQEEAEEAERVRRLAETLPEDIAREAERVAEEKAEKENHKAILAEGLLADKEATARSRAIGISKSDMSPDEKHVAMLETGFALGTPASSERDARYTHRELGFSFYLRGTALGMTETPRPKKARGVELVVMTKEDHERNRKAKLAAKLARKPAPKANTPKVDKKAEKEAKKNKKGTK